MNNEEIGSKISFYRKKAKLTQKELGDKLGVTYSTISKYENGNTAVPSDLLDKITIALGITIYDLYSESINPTFQRIVKIYDVKKHVSKRYLHTQILILFLSMINIFSAPFLGLSNTISINLLLWLISFILGLRKLIIGNTNNLKSISVPLNQKLFFVFHKNIKRKYSIFTIIFGPFFYITIYFILLAMTQQMENDQTVLIPIVIFLISVFIIGGILYFLFPSNLFTYQKINDIVESNLNLPSPVLD